MFERLRDFWEYGPLLTAQELDQRKKQIARNKKRAAERAAKRRQQAIEEYRSANADLGVVDRYVFGVTPEDIVRNRRRVERQKLAQMRSVFRDEMRDEINVQARYLLRNVPWYKTDEETIAGARRIAEREAWREHRDDYLQDLEDGDFDV